MSNYPLQECSLELAAFLAEQASKTLADPAVREGEELQTRRPLSGYNWDGTAI